MSFWLCALFLVLSDAALHHYIYRRSSSISNLDTCFAWWDTSPPQVPLYYCEGGDECGPYGENVNELFTLAQAQSQDSAYTDLLQYHGSEACTSSCCADDSGGFSGNFGQVSFYPSSTTACCAGQTTYVDYVCTITEGWFLISETSTVAFQGQSDDAWGLWAEDPDGVMTLMAYRNNNHGTANDYAPCSSGTPCNSNGSPPDVSIHFTYAPGFYQFRVYFEENGGGCVNKLLWSLNGGSYVMIPEDKLFVQAYTIGNGVLEYPPYEQCDDGNVDNGDGCDDAGQVEVGWTCTDVVDTLSVCSTTCGDGIRAGDEQCDELEEISALGCSSTCTILDGYEMQDREIKLLSKGSFGDYELDQTTFYSAAVNGGGVMYRICPGCDPDYDLIYFKATKPTQLPTLEQFKSDWPIDTFGIEYNLYSTLEDALAGTGAWDSCTTAASGIGFPADCSVTTIASSGQYNSWTLDSSQPDVLFYIYGSFPTAICGDYIVQETEECDDSQEGCSNCEIDFGATGLASSSWVHLIHQEEGVYFPSGDDVRSCYESTDGSVFSTVCDHEDALMNADSYEFEVQWYSTGGGATVGTHQWKQTHSIFDSYSIVDGYEPLGGDWPAEWASTNGGPVTDSSGSACTYFYGLAYSTSYCGFDGNGLHGCWWNCVGSSSAYSGAIPGPSSIVVGAVDLYFHSSSDGEIPMFTVRSHSTAVFGAWDGTESCVDDDSVSQAYVSCVTDVGVGIERDCSIGTMTYQEADVYCTDMGGRLPTRSEVQAGAIGDMGCSYDGQLEVWTTTSCGRAFYAFAWGADWDEDTASTSSIPITVNMRLFGLDVTSIYASIQGAVGINTDTLLWDATRALGVSSQPFIAAHFTQWDSACTTLYHRVSTAAEDLDFADTQVKDLYQNGNVADFAADLVVVLTWEGGPEACAGRLERNVVQMALAYDSNPLNPRTFALFIHDTKFLEWRYSDEYPYTEPLQGTDNGQSQSVIIPYCEEDVCGTAIRVDTSEAVMQPSVASETTNLDSWDVQVIYLSTGFSQYAYAQDGSSPIYVDELCEIYLTPHLAYDSLDCTIEVTWSSSTTQVPVAMASGPWSFSEDVTVQFTVTAPNGDQAVFSQDLFLALDTDSTLVTAVSAATDTTVTLYGNPYYEISVTASTLATAITVDLIAASQEATIEYSGGSDLYSSSVVFDSLIRGGTVNDVITVVAQDTAYSTEYAVTIFQPLDSDASFSFQVDSSDVPVCTDGNGFCLVIEDNSLPLIGVSVTASSQYAQSITIGDITADATTASQDVQLTSAAYFAPTSIKITVVAEDDTEISSWLYVSSTPSTINSISTISVEDALNTYTLDPVTTISDPPAGVCLGAVCDDFTATASTWTYDSAIDSATVSAGYTMVLTFDEGHTQRLTEGTYGAADLDDGTVASVYVAAYRELVLDASQAASYSSGIVLSNIFDFTITLDDADSRMLVDGVSTASGVVKSKTLTWSSFDGFEYLLTVVVTSQAEVSAYTDILLVFPAVNVNSLTLDACYSQTVVADGAVHAIAAQVSASGDYFTVVGTATTAPVIELRSADMTILANSESTADASRITLLFPDAGTYYVLVYGSATVTLNICAGIATTLGVADNAALDLAQNEWSFFKTSIGANYYSYLTVGHTGSSSDADLYILTTSSSRNLDILDAANNAGSASQVLSVPGANSEIMTALYTFATLSGQVSVDLPTPTVSGINPTTGSTAGSVVFVSGTAFGTGGAFDGTITIGGAECTSPLLVSDSSVQCTAPSGTGVDHAVQVTMFSGASTSNAYSSFAYIGPSISAFTVPDDASTEGFLLTIFGSNFGGDAAGVSVMVGGDACTGITVTDHTSIECTAPPAYGTQEVTVEVDGQSSSTSALVYDPPVLDGLDASSFSTDGSGTLTLTGANFGAQASVVEVSVGDAVCTSVVLTTPHLTLECDLPEGYGENNRVVATVDGQSSGSLFLDYDAPVIGSFLPDPVPAAATTVDISGSNFGPADFDISVTLLGGTCEVTSHTHDSITCTLPSRLSTLPSANAYVDVSTLSDTASLTYADPVISVSSDPVSTAGINTFVISGSDLSGTVSATLNGAALEVIDSADDAITVVFPEGQGTALVVQVQVSGMSSNTVQVDYAAPSIDSVTYTRNGVSEPFPDTRGGSVAQLSGSDFGTTGTVTSGDVVCSVVSWGHDAVSITVPAGSGASEFLLTTGGQTVTEAYSYVGPVLTSVTPSSISTAGSTASGNLVIDGTDFTTNQGTVDIGSYECTVISWGQSSIVCEMPEGRGENLDVIVTADSLQGTLSGGLSFASPAITGVTADTFPTAGNVDIVISGSSFDTSGSVTVGGEPCDTASGSYSHSSITCLLPAGSGIGVEVIVTTVDSRASEVYLINYDPPNIDQMTPDKISVVEEQITFSGSNFGTNPTVTLDGVACVIDSVADDELVVTIQSVPTTSSSFLITNDGQTDSISVSAARPVFSAISPTNGNTGPADSVLLTISGSYLFNSDLDVTVGVGSLECAVQTHSETEITCFMPESIDFQTVSLSVGGQEASETYLFQYSRPTITDISDKDAMPVSETSIVITGTSFSTNPSVHADNILLTIAVSDHSSITAILPAGVGTRDIVVQAGTQTSDVFTVTHAAPEITNFNPTSLLVTGGDVEITGANFAPGFTHSITIEGQFCLVDGASVSATSLSCTYPVGSGAGLAVVLTLGGLSATGTVSYTTAQITDATAESFPTSGLTTLVVTGTNFGSANVVYVDEVASSTTAATSDGTVLSVSLPSGSGTVDVYVVTGGLQSNTVSITYDMPTISSIVSVPAPTAGNTESLAAEVVIYGSNFYTTGAVVLIGNSVCDVTYQTHDLISCTSPEGAGGSVTLEVDISGQSATSTYIYDGPVVDSLSVLDPFPTNANQGGNPAAGFVIQGSNFGSADASVTVTAGGLSCTITERTHDTITIESIPTGSGLQQELVVSVELVDSDIFAYDYAAPEVTGVTGCADSGSTTLDCAVTGTTITVAGSNFGTAATVTIGGLDCPVSAINTEGTSIECGLQSLAHSAASSNLAVEVTLTGQSGSDIAVFVSYIAPSITDASFMLNGVSCSGACMMSNIIQDTILDFTGSGLMSVDAPVVTLGTIENPTMYFLCNTANDAISISANLYSSGSACERPIVGHGLFVYVEDPTVGIMSAASVDTITTPTPVIASSVTLDGISTTSLAQSSSDSDYLTFEVENIGVTDIEVFYGQSEPYEDFQCTDVSATRDSASTTTEIRCLTEKQTGSDYLFIVKVHGLTSAPSTWMYAYPAIPVIFSVESADCGTTGGATLGDTVSDCASTGGALLTILGESFGITLDAVTVLIGADVCALVSVSDDSTSIICLTPAKTGDHPLYVLSGGLLSPPFYQIGYAAPTVDTVTGCTGSGSATVDCPRDAITASTSITITGTHMGMADAYILVGLEVCANPVHTTDQTSVVCDLPNGVSVDQPVVVFQSGGKVSTQNGLLSYVQCQPGTYQSSDTDYACTACDAGRYTSEISQTECKSCASGTFAGSSGASECDKCGLGEYSVQTDALTGPTQCEECLAGTYNSAQQQSACIECAEGTFSASAKSFSCTTCDRGEAAQGTANTECTACVAGKYAGAVGQGQCDNCNAGSYSGDAASDCTACPAGTSQASQGSSDCVDCVQGSAQPAEGQVVCLQCNSGTYADASNMENCITCSAGTYSVKGHTGPIECTECAIGYYVSTDGQSNCDACDYGTYQPDAAATTCVRCPPGQFADSLASAMCTNCSIGYAAQFDGQFECSACAVGQVAPNTGSIVCDACVPGKYQSSTGQAQCDDCLAGRYTSSSGQYTCTACDAGFYAPENQADGCIACAAGTATSSVASSGCDDCLAGTYSSTTAQVSCLPCDAGSFSSADAATGCAPCPAGQYAPLSSANTGCQNCARGYFSASSGQGYCEGCAIGSYGPTEGASACIACDPGAFQSTENQETCTDCPVGWYNTFYGQAVCVICNGGFYSNSTGSTECVSCPVGEFQPATGASTCDLCVTGRYNPSLGQKDCIDCAVGTYQSATGAVECTDCEAGRASAVAVSSSCSLCTRGKFSAPAAVVCENCPAGSISTSSEADACIACDEGTYSSSSGNFACTDCPAGSIQPTTGQTECAACNAGTKANEVSTECVICDAGTFAASVSSTTCDACPAGTSSGNGASACVSCAAGFFSESSSSSCTSCPVGKFQGSSGSSECIDCAPGSYIGSVGASVCLDCSAGRYATEVARTSCTVCPAGSACEAGATDHSPCDAGTFSSGTGMSTCTDCDPGTISETASSTTCTQCQGGTIAAYAGLTECSACDAGFYASGVARTICTPCAAGYFADETGMDACVACNAGSEQGQSEATGCDSCLPGFYSDSSASTVCLPCAVGTYVASPGATQCLATDPGTVQPFTGQSDFDVCNLGQYMSAYGQAVCVECDEGKFANSTELTECVECPAGTYSVKDADGNGASSCIDCPVGKYTQSFGQAVCFECEPGDFNDQPGATICSACDAGKFSENAGSSECVACAAGSYAPNPGVAVCLDCEKGRFATYDPLDGVAGCTKCATGSYQDVTGSSSCVQCAASTYAANEGTVTCVACDSGTFTDQIGMASCTRCAAGSYQANSGQSSCQECAPGTFQGSPGQGSCFFCDAGTATAANGSTICEQCELGKSIGGAGQTACVDCSAGKVASSVGSVACTDCEPGRFTSQVGFFACDICQAGEYQSAYQAIECVACSAGTYSSLDGVDQCTQCAAGTYGNMTGMTGCIQCPAGSYQSSKQSESCDLCAVGMVSYFAGAEACSACPAGSYSSIEGGVGCPLCESGTYRSVEGQSSCLNCADGKYAKYSGASICTDCNPGYYSVADTTTFITTNETDDMGFIVVAVPSTTGAATCSQCEPGSYQSFTGMSTCQLCPTGEYSSSASSIQCAICASGTYTNDEGMTACLTCAPGSFSYEGADVCDLCDAGYYSYSGSSQCTMCELGMYSNVSGTSTCRECQPGTFSYASVPNTGCVDCPTGTYLDRSAFSTCFDCQTGRFQNMTGSTECSLCNPGKIAPVEGLDDCSDCGVGTSTILSGQAECIRCEMGRYAANEGQAECDLCQPGSAQGSDAQVSCDVCIPGRAAQFEGMTTCFDCEAGKFTNDSAVVTCDSCLPGTAQSEAGRTSCYACQAGTFADGGSSECTPCQEGSVTAEAGMSECSICDQYSDPNDAATECLCGIGYAAEYVNGTTEAICRECPDGAECVSVGVQWANLEAAVGFWEGTDGTYYRCLLASHCDGGDNGECANNRDGPLCAQCMDGYTESSLDGTCQACPENANQSWLWLIMVLVVGIILLVAQYYAVVKSAQKLLKTSDLMERLNSGEEAEVTLDQLDIIMKNLRFGENITVDGPPSARPEFLYKLKVCISFLQILCNLSLTLEIDYPSGFIEFVNLFNPANLDFISIASVDCVQNVDYYTELYCWCALPIILFGSVFVFYLLPEYLRNGGDHAKNKRSRRMYWRQQSYTLFLVYPIVSSAVLRIFVCKEVESVWYLQSDFSVLCFDDAWNTNAIIAGIFILLYPIGIPLFLYRKILHYRYFQDPYGKTVNRLETLDIRAELGFLYDAYNMDVWYFDLLDMMHKLATTSLIAFLPWDYQLPICMVVMLFHLCTILLMNPYIRKGDDKLHLLAQVELILVVMAGNIFNKTEYDSLMDVVLSVVLIAMCLFFMVAFLVTVGGAVKHMLIEREIISPSLSSKQNQENELEEYSKFMSLHRSNVTDALHRARLMVQSQAERL